MYLTTNGSKCETHNHNYIMTIKIYSIYNFEMINGKVKIRTYQDVC